MLWLVVGVALFLTYKNRSHRAPQIDPTDNAIDLTSSGGATKGSDLQPIVLNPQAAKETDLTTTKWNPAGIEDFSLTEASGRTITKQDLLGKPWAVCFIFRECAGPCPRVTQAMKTQLQDQLQDVDIRLVTITVDPKNDTPLLLEQYAKHFRADRKKWWFLTGNQGEIYRLIRDSFQMPVKEITGPDRQQGFQVIHTSNVLHVNAKGVVQGKYNAQIEADMLKLRKALKQEAAQLAAHIEPAERTPVIAPRP